MRRIKSATTKKNTIPKGVREVEPSKRFIVNLDTEDTDFLIVYADESSVVLLALDNTYDTITIPISQFLKGRYTFKVDGEKYVAKLTIKEVE